MAAVASAAGYDDIERVGAGVCGMFHLELTQF